MPFDRYWQNMVLIPIFFIYSDREMFKIISEKGFQSNTIEKNFDYRVLNFYLLFYRLDCPEFSSIFA